ncbi:unnamed protein product [Spirodela intermedia]|uniref:GATA-type domain-containing protein n=2 Tax=Spirodela intermedia TaxID=51605 RepID=A0A7I8LJ09_SPIIN|nr:unnamed protein product [Spirodela intermedia]CAA6672798.1 unnamed protein product [Spirodela intermedia]CAA7410017.1 unnamed protein product [Spirodela intermedia]
MGSVATTGDGESSHKDGDGEECNPLDGGSGKWMSSKMRFMRKMTGSDKVASGRPRKNALGSNDHLRKFAENNVNNDNHSLPNGSIRVCSECNTTKTPLWRSGPGGPKSLCNACGIRQRKARRAMAAAAAAVTGGLIPAVAPVVKVRKQKRSGGACAVPFKKRFKCFAAAETRHKLHFDELTIALSKNSAFHGVFPQDEKEAAILLMALSSGLIRG